MTRIAMFAALAAAPVLAVAQYAIYKYAPLEQTMGLAQKIFYSHLPLAWWGMFSLAVVFGASVVYLRSRSLAADMLAQAGAELGVLFCSLAIVTGSIWGRAAWGVWWTWDPRLTTTLVMCLTYAAYLVLRTAPLPPGRASMACAVIGVVGFVNLPLVFFSARMWRSIHPAVVGAEGGGMEPEMWHAMFVSLGAVGLLWLGLLLARQRTLLAQARAEGLAARIAYMGDER